MLIYMKDNLMKIKNVDKVQKSVSMEMFIQDSLKMINIKDLEN